MKFIPLIREEDRIAGFRQLAALKQTWIEGYLDFASRQIPVLKTRLSRSDHLGALRVRFNIGRKNYSVLPGLYALGRPDTSSPVLVSANYKLTIDSLRRELAGLSAWLIVLDTKGINVWCAAGKGSFGTKELIAKLKATKLVELVKHRCLVLPQLGATGVCAPEVARQSGFRIVWGPVRAADLPAFLAQGMKKDEPMSRVRFSLVDRLKLSPVELIQTWPVAAAALFLAMALALPPGRSWTIRFIGWSGSLLGIWLSGTLAFPLLLPLLPGKAFSVKGALLGTVWGISAAALTGIGPWSGLALSLISASVVSFLGMNFTGSTTFTSQSGALLEVDKAIIPQALTLAAGLVLGLVITLTGWRGAA